MNDYIETPIKKPTTKVVKDIKRKEQSHELSRVSTLTMILFLVRKHKYFIVCTYAVVVSMFYFIPTTPQFILSLFQ